MKLDHPLESGDIYLRSLVRSDATLAYLGWLSDPQVSQYLEVRFSPPQSQTQLENFIELNNAGSGNLMLGMFLCADQQHIGNIKLGPIDWNHRSADIGLLVGEKSEWGKGYASLAISLVADYAFKQLKLVKLTAGCYAGNQGSEKAFLKAGFALEGRRLSQWQVGDHRQDGLLLGKVNPDMPLLPTS